MWLYMYIPLSTVTLYSVLYVVQAVALQVPSNTHDIVHMSHLLTIHDIDHEQSDQAVYSITEGTV